MTIKEIDDRIAEIRSTVDAKDPNTDYQALNEEIDTLTAARTQAVEEQRRADLAAVIDGAGADITKTIIPQEDTKVKEFRNSPEYLEAFVKFIKTGDDKECRALLTENAEDGTLVVPTAVEDKIRTAWDKSDLFSRVGKSYIKGNLKIGFEISGTDAVVHIEGSGKATEEDLELGAVSIVPQTIKKWISFSDEAMDLKGQAFIDYIYDELAYRIVQKAENLVVAAIVASVGTSTPTMAGQATLAAEVGPTTVIKAIALTSDEATDLVVIGNKQTWAAFKSLTTTDGYKLQDPFEGLDFVFNNSLPSYDTANENESYLIVGDLANGVRVNLPNGTDVRVKLDENSLAEEDLVKAVGRLYAGIGVIMPNAFTVVTKPAAEG